MTDNTNERLQDLLLDPKESLDVEIKGWLDLNDNTHKSVLAKALIALANHGGGERTHSNRCADIQVI